MGVRPSGVLQLGDPGSMDEDEVIVLLRRACNFPAPAKAKVLGHRRELEGAHWAVHGIPVQLCLAARSVKLGVALGSLPSSIDLL